ncbi:glycosyltransferase [Pseudonocardia acidicola]|uniref:Glycosyltransferase family 1 protein n=1 Tax=Pseudonocardia acidicola TaxID=2724939 RepID=A0ABX1SDM9_9PSEU|nr:glycosyltransferase [Pseudonocardia acidicola]NMH98374.1 glycosyltransferase family 1 protein [Pseudonocardia acidicola]
MKIDMISEHASPLAPIGGVDAGGQNVHVAELARALGRRGHDVVVHTRRDAPDLPDRVVAAPGVTVEHVPAGPARPVPKDDLLPYMPAFGDHLARRWARRRPDVAHAHFWLSGLAARHGAAVEPVPLLQTFHALGHVKRKYQGAKDTSPPLRTRAEAELAGDVAMVIATCSDEVGELRAMGLSAERAAVVPCGVDLGRFTPRGPRARRGARPRLLSIGRLVERKGVQTVIRALREVPDAELIVAGGPPGEQAHADPDVARLRTIAQRCGVADRVRFLGQVPRSEVPALFRSADLVVSVPWYEPFGIVPVEAMACGTPVVVSAVGGHLDTVVEGETGCFVPARCSDALAARLRELLAAPAARAEMGRAGARRARAGYGWDWIAEQTEALYQEVAVRPLPGPAELSGAVT